KRLEHPGALLVGRLTPDGRRLAATIRTGATVEDGQVVLWDVRPWRQCARLAVPGLCGNAIALSDDATQLATTAYHDGVTGWDSPTHRERFSWKVQIASALAFTRDGTLLACALGPNVWLCSPATGEEIGLLRGHERPVLALGFSPNGRLLASGDFGGIV